MFQSSRLARTVKVTIQFIANSPSAPKSPVPQVTNPGLPQNTHLLEFLFRHRELCFPHLLLLLHALLQVSQHPLLLTKPQLSTNLLQPSQAEQCQGWEALAYPRIWAKVWVIELGAPGAARSFLFLGWLNYPAHQSPCCATSHHHQEGFQHN